VKEDKVVGFLEYLKKQEHLMTRVHTLFDGDDKGTAINILCSWMGNDRIEQMLEILEKKEGEE
jgi:hypothetical protein